MDQLLAKVRDLVNDPAGAGAVFTDDQVQAFLDGHRVEVRGRELYYLPTRAVGGTDTYVDFYAAFGDWESDGELKDDRYNVLALDNAKTEWLLGHWVLQATKTPPVYLSAKSYDVHMAAADLLRAWAAKLKGEFDFGADGDSFNRSQRYVHLLELAEEYESRSRRYSRPVPHADLSTDRARLWR